jgi:hypothetical protein
VQFTALVMLQRPRNQQGDRTKLNIGHGMMSLIASGNREVMLCWDLPGCRREQRQRHGPSCLGLVAAAPAAVTRCSLVAHSKGSSSKARHPARAARIRMRRHTRSLNLRVHQQTPQLRRSRATAAPSRSIGFASLRRRRGAGSTAAALRGLRSGTGTDKRC